MLNRSITTLVLTAALTLVSQVVAAQTAEEKGLEISQQVKLKDLGWIDSTADMLMILRNNQGQKSIRKIKMKSLEQLNDGDKSLIIFNKPKDVKGTTFLTFSHPKANDDQWLYLPALKRVKRISSRNKSGPFMGSEFAFEDLSSFEVEKYSYKYVGDESLNSVATFKVEQYPRGENSGYTKRIVWIDKQAHRIQKIEFYDRKNSLLKNLSYVGYKQYLSKFWRADSMVMINHQTGKSTELKWTNYAFKTGLKNSDFSRNALKRAR